MTEGGLSAAARRALERGGLDMAPRRASEASAEAATAVEIEALLDTAWSVKTTAAHLGLTEERVRKMLRDRSVLGFKRGGVWRVPSVQVSEGRILPGLSAVLKAMPGDLDPIERWAWLTGPDPDLVVRGEAVSPLAWLRDGRSPDRAAILARDL